MTRIFATPAADADLEAIAAYQAREEGHEVALRYQYAFERAFQTMADVPLMRTLQPALGPEVRIGVVDPYRIAYRYDAKLDEVTILRVIHPKAKVMDAVLVGRPA